MPLGEDVHTFLDQLVETEANQAAYEAGYEAGSDKDFRTSFLGGAPTRFGVRDSLSASVHLEDAAGKDSWYENRILPRDGYTALVTNPAFVLGAVVAALEEKPALEEAQQARWAEKFPDDAKV